MANPQNFDDPGYYAWIKAAPVREQQELQDRTDFELILTAYKMHGYSKGARSIIYMALLHMEPPVIMNLKKIHRLMKNITLSVRIVHQSLIDKWLELLKRITLQKICCSGNSNVMGLV